MIIRQEQAADLDEVYELIKKAFETAEHSDGNEQDLAVKLRKSTAFVPELSLVAEENNKIVGHILFTKAKINDNTILALAPLSVSPENQKQGIGKALINRAHEIAKQMGYEYSIVLGSEKYYPKSGYVEAEKFGIKAPFEVPSENFMAINLKGNSAPLNGTVEYTKEFFEA